MRSALVAAQGFTFLALGGLLCREGNWRLGAAQLLLAIITGLVYA
ncbi:MAG: hypothetical protein ACXVHB_05850 [Solirubrobacteraceae bacterium]